MSVTEALSDGNGLARNQEWPRFDIAPLLTDDTAKALSRLDISVSDAPPPGGATALEDSEAVGVPELLTLG